MAHSTIPQGTTTSVKTNRNKRLDLSFLLPFLGLFLFALPAWSQSAAHVDTLKSTKFERKLRSEKGRVILDVRTPAEFTQGHIPGAVNINVKDGTFVRKVSELDKNSPVYVYCRSGVRSAKAVELLKNEGFTKIYNLRGGIQAWTQKGLPVDDSVKTTKSPAGQ